MKLSSLTLGMLLSASLLGLESPIRVPVKGLVCSFCARGLTQVLKKQKSIHKFEIQVSKGEFLIWIKKSFPNPTESEIREWVRKSGLEVDKI